jgi:hypothetical protein
MDEDDPRKFSLATPQQGTSAYLWCLTISLPSKRIIEDWNGVIDIMWRIHGYQGIIFPDANGKQMREGHRAAAAFVGAENTAKRVGIALDNSHWMSTIKNLSIILMQLLDCL